MRDKPGTQYQKSELSKKGILDAAMRLVLHKSFEAMSIRDICKEAGLSIGAFYHHFPSKDALMNEAFLHFDNTLDEDTAAKKYDKLPPVDAIRTVLVDQTAFTANMGYTVITQYYRALLQNQNRSAVSPRRAYYQSVRRHVRRAQRAGDFTNALETEEIAEMLIKYVRGNLVDWCLHDGAYDVAARTDAELREFMRALMA
ncbi:MAG: TetR/AcrR family transcriptional regulator; helix-turn-helix transcriptional regulator [Clostridiales bacterium]|jgi:AcrR family transcriptional regulator|nr:TetR/AcrR family transcriptional regulator; helix-turn-helix transcriptional regulator [Clostridiales bacterium]